MAFAHLHLNNAYILHTSYQADGRDPHALLKGDMPLFYSLLVAVAQYTVRAFSSEKEDQLGEACLLGCFSSRGLGLFCVIFRSCFP